MLKTPIGEPVDIDRLILIKPPVVGPAEFRECYIPGANLWPVLNDIIAGTLDRFGVYSMRTSWEFMEHVRAEIQRRGICGRWGDDGVPVFDPKAGHLPISCWESADGLMFGEREEGGTC